MAIATHGAGEITGELSQLAGRAALATPWVSVEVDKPRTHITCIPGAGQMIVTPNFLLEHRPDVVTVMGPIYPEEIASELAAMDSSAELVMVKRSQEKAAACPAAGL